MNFRRCILGHRENCSRTGARERPHCASDSFTERSWDFRQRKKNGSWQWKVSTTSPNEPGRQKAHFGDDEKALGRAPQESRKILLGKTGSILSNRAGPSANR